jgi:aryl-alcohol dehydrogenase-like predicted oxidoreductase
LHDGADSDARSAACSPARRHHSLLLEVRMVELLTRRLGRTGRQVTTLGLGGQASIQWPAEGLDPIAIIEKALRLGVNYLDTSNVYGPSQKHFGEAFRRRGLVPGAAGYDPAARARLFIATKTHLRTARRPDGLRFRSDFSEGMLDAFKVASAVDDVRRSLSLMFGDGQGGYPEGAYLDSIQFHNLNSLDEVDMLYEGFDDPHPDRPLIGALAAMLDLRQGENRTGCNPRREKLVRHIGITGHWNSAVHIEAIQRDTRRVIDTLLVTVNPSDGQYFGHRHNAIAVAKAADMGVIGMKVFADAAYYHKDARFSHRPADVYAQVGSEALPSDELIRYSLSVDGVNSVIVGIGHIDDEPGRCQLQQNLTAAQLAAPLSAAQLAGIEAKVGAAGKHGANGYFQRKALGLGAARHVGAEADTTMPLFRRVAVRVRWDTAYAGAFAIERYQVLRDDLVVGEVPHLPQYTRKPFHFDDLLQGEAATRAHEYKVRTFDASGNHADSGTFTVDPVVLAI